MPIQGKDLNSGIRGGLWDKKHKNAMGSAIWLFGWCVHRQTKQRNGEGLVLGGKPLSYEMIQEDTGFEEWELKRWMAVLKECGYISIVYGSYKRMIIRVLKAKKFSSSAPGHKERNPRYGHSAKTAPIDHPIRADSAPFKQGTEVSTEQIKEGAIYFKGVIVVITTAEELLLTDTFPHLNRDVEYRSADAWCIDKKKTADTIESMFMFMRRWMLRTERGLITQDDRDLKARSEAHVGTGPVAADFGVTVKPEALARIRARAHK